MLNIALIQGGTSTERSVSFETGKGVAQALSAIGHDVTVYSLDADTLEDIDLSQHDFAFICLHGGWGENGGIQVELEKAGIPYSGSGALSSRLAMDKELTKAKFLKHRIPTAAYIVTNEKDAWLSLSSMSDRHGWPLAIKPVDQGSSMGVTVAKDRTAAQAGLDQAFSLSDRVMIERGVIGRELTVGIIDQETLPVVEVVPRREFYDFEAKYSDEGTRYVTKPKLSEVQRKLAQHFALKAHNALRCHGYSRVDMIMTEGGELSILEVNTLPGMTQRSLLPLAAAEAGMSYEEVLQAMVDASMESRERKRSQVFIPRTSGRILNLAA